MNLEAVARAEARLLLPTYDRKRVLFRRGQGCYLWDDRGRRYLDWLSGIGVCALGYNHPAVLAAIRKQAPRLVHISNLFYHDYQAALAERLARISGLDRAFFCNSGSEAIEGALKLARAYARLHNKNGSKAPWRFLAMENSFHGRTAGALAATATKKYREPFEPLLPGVRFVKFNNAADLEKKFDGSVCAVLLEPIQGEGGINPVTPEFFSLARKLAERHGALLIADEIQCGLGRTGEYFAFQKYGVTPDILALAKPLASGLPLGAIVTREHVAAAIKPGLHGTTFGGGPLACAVAITFLDTLQRENVIANVRRVGKYFREKLETVKRQHPSVVEARGIGLMLALQLGVPGKDVVDACLARGLVINCTHDTVLRFLPPFIITEKQVDEGMKLLDQALTEVESKNGSRVPHPSPGLARVGVTTGKKR
ncbi:MAG: aspartate aminotransferase family protein [Acidobacteriia bacterium]|nr:aspartate aminotransferase family protein [Terriglobia bacterium]